MKRQKPTKIEETAATETPIVPESAVKKAKTDKEETGTDTSPVSVPARAESDIMKPMDESEAWIFGESSKMMRKFAEYSKEEMRRVREQKDILDLREKMKAEQNQGPAR